MARCLTHRPWHRTPLCVLTAVVAGSSCSSGVIGEPLGQEGAHEHGVAAMSMVVEGNDATLTFRAPAGDLWGFERAPRSDEEVDARRRALTSLEAGLVAALGLDTRLGCAVRAVRWSGAAVSPLVPQGQASQNASAHAHAHAHAHGHTHDDEGVRSHGDGGTDEDEYEHEHGSDAEAEFEITCEAPLAGTRLTLGLADLFENIERVDLQIVSESQQFGRRVPARGTRIGL